MLGQALVAASQTVEPNRHPHSLHRYFMRPGDTTFPIPYKVDRICDGKSFTARRVVKVQRGKAILSMSISFQADEPGFSDQAEIPDVPSPDALKNEAELLADYIDPIPIQYRDSFTRGRPLRFDRLKRATTHANRKNVCLTRRAG